MENTGFMKKLYKYLLLTGASLIMSYVILSYLNANMFIKDDPSPSVSNVNKPTPTPAASSTAPQKTIITGIPVNTGSLMFSYDNQYCVYLFDGKIFVKEIKTDRLLRTIEAKDAPITNAVLMDDRNIVIYFTIDSSGLINVNTYNIDKNEIINDSSFKAAAGSVIKKTDYSSLTNLIYINVKYVSNNKETDKVYYLNIVKRLKRASTAGIVDNMVLLANTSDLYYQDNKNALYRNSFKVKSVNLKKIILLGKDSNDNIYAQLLDDKKTIYVLKKDTVVNTINLDKTDYSRIIANKSDIYAVYSSYMIDISGNPTLKMPYDGKTNFLAIVGSKIYLQGNDGTIIQSGVNSSSAGN